MTAASYAPPVGGRMQGLEIVLDEAAAASLATGVEVGVVVAASRPRHPLEARTLARRAARYAGDGPGQVVGFGLSNDERRAAPTSSARRSRSRAAPGSSRCRTAASCSARST